MILDMSLAGIRKAIADGEVRSEDAVAAYLNQISLTENSIHAYRDVFSDEALETARKWDRKHNNGDELPLLAGVPIAVKDVICTSWGRTTCSSKILENFHAPYNATVISRLLDAGAVILGKTNMDEFAMGSSTENSAFGPTYNPWNVDYVPGGSSGGSAAAVAVRSCAGAIGSDTGGSIRQPAAFCGVVGMKPTYGLVSRYGLVAYGSSLDQIGPLAQDVTDCAILLQVLAGHDPKDSTSVATDTPDYLSSIDNPVAQLTIGLPKEFMAEGMDRSTLSAVKRAVHVFRSMGVRIEEVSLPHSRIEIDEDGGISSHAVSCYYIIAMAEASSNLSRYDGVQYGHRTQVPTSDVIDLYSRSRSEGLGEEVKRRILLGTYTLSSGYYDAYYSKALKVRRLIKEDFDRAFRSCDVLLGPVTPSTAFKIGEKKSDPLAMYLEDIYTISLNLAGLPGLAIPCGLAGNGLPVGFQLIGPAFSESTLLQMARAFEKESGFQRLDGRNPIKAQKQEAKLSQKYPSEDRRS